MGKNKFSQGNGEKLKDADLPNQEVYSLRLFIAGNTTHSAHAILNLRKVCEERLHGRYELEVVDIYQQPAFARSEQIIATPTLIKMSPSPVRKFIGDLSDTPRLLVGLNLIP